MTSAHQVKILDVHHVTPFFTPPEFATELSLPLTFFDIMWLKLQPVGYIFFYKLTESTPAFFNSVILPKLKHSLSHTLIHFLPLAGNITWPPQATTPIILYTPNDAIQLTVAESNADFDHLSGNDIREAMKSHLYLPELPVTDAKATAMTMQITLFPNQGFCLVHMSSFVLLYAYVVICIVKSKGLEQNRKVVFGFLADCRARLDPPIHDKYFGNCLYSFAVDTEARALLEENGFAWAVERLTALLLGVAGSTHYDVYGTDLGWGRPEKVEITSIDQTAAISMTKCKNGSGVEFALVLEKNEMEKFMSLFVDGVI
ncbi:phenolic glucoside malonyltransferase 1 [Populus trichocarpa]|uniref:phenolic glucoside malonyltransferase 1 n=1 Tax=Populus trichocarpa TaxID=3694 RepID=UPI000D18B0D5|nr:phenolic glucoside malonyltransferase 1 [Populus trichocarpa]|eukprot:XP_024455886.1 phenolic glucoside malonyltransferase 1 [Populus trichocarpa]